MSLIEIKAAYDRGENILQLYRKQPEAFPPGFDPVLVSYDMQAGKYVASLARADIRKYYEDYAAALAAEVAAIGPKTILEAGVGEATTLRAFGEACATIGSEADLFGFDLSWSRVQWARRHCRESNTVSVREASLAVGTMEEMPCANDSFDLVFTSHAIEPNRGREREFLDEIHRVAREWVILLEPGYEFASQEARERMDLHGYCREIPRHAAEAGFEVVKHELFAVTANPLNPTAITLLKKTAAGNSGPTGFACPISKGDLEPAEPFLHSPSGLVTYPVLDGIPCLLPRNAILTTCFQPEKS